MEKELLTVDDFLRIFSISRSSFYIQVKKENITIKKLGRRTYISRIDAAKWADSLDSNITE